MENIYAGHYHNRAERALSIPFSFIFLILSNFVKLENRMMKSSFGIHHFYHAFSAELWRTTNDLIIQLRCTSSDIALTNPQTTVQTLHLISSLIWSSCLITMSSRNMALIWHWQYYSYFFAVFVLLCSAKSCSFSFKTKQSKNQMDKAHKKLAILACFHGSGIDYSVVYS